MTNTDEATGMTALCSRCERNMTASPPICRECRDDDDYKRIVDRDPPSWSPLDPDGPTLEQLAPTREDRDEWRRERYQ